MTILKLPLYYIMLLLHFCTVNTYKMAKNKERQNAYEMFVEMFKTQKEIAEFLEVSEKTVGNWVKKGNWKAERDARLNSHKTQTQNIRDLISDLTEEAQALTEQIRMAAARGERKEATDLKKQRLLISQEVASYNKTLDKIDKENKFSLSTYIDVQEDIFNALKEYDTALYLKTIDFQKQHIQHKSQTLS